MNYEYNQLEPNCKYFKIFINNLLHLSIKKKDLISIRSWFISPEKDPDPYFIEITYKTTKVICQYDNKEKWQSILNLLNII